MTPLLAIALILAATIWLFGLGAVLHAIGMIFLYAGATAGLAGFWWIIGEGR